MSERPGDISALWPTRICNRDVLTAGKPAVNLSAVGRQELLIGLRSPRLGRRHPYILQLPPDYIFRVD